MQLFSCPVTFTKICCGFILLLPAYSCNEGPAVQSAISYSVANAHSHNDYAHAQPFWRAYDYGFGSIEADIFLDSNGTDLWVAHSREELQHNRRSLDSLYLLPLNNCLNKNDGQVFAEEYRTLQLLIDVKTEAGPTIAALQQQLAKFPELINCNTLQIVVSGNRPDPADYAGYAPYLFFDGRPGESYDTTALSKIGLISASFRDYSDWDGKGPLSEEEQQKIRSVVEQAHALHKPFRFWATPDTPACWEQLMKWQVDYINTDKLKGLSVFLRHHS